jgi:hypothetical protein
MGYVRDCILFFAAAMVLLALAAGFWWSVVEAIV